MCLEGEISRQSILNSLSRGKKASGDLIPWTVSEQVRGAAAGVSDCERVVCALQSLVRVSHSFKTQTLEAFLVDGLFVLLFTRIIKG